MQPLDQEIFNIRTGCKKEEDCLYSISLLFLPALPPRLFFFFFWPYSGFQATPEEHTRALDYSKPWFCSSKLERKLATVQGTSFALQPTRNEV